MNFCYVLPCVRNSIINKNEPIKSQAFYLLTPSGSSNGRPSTLPCQCVPCNDGSTGTETRSKLLAVVNSVLQEEYLIQEKTLH